MASPELYNIYRVVNIHDTLDLALGPCDAVYAGAAGTVAAVASDNTVTTFTVVPGVILPIKARRINLTGTSVAGTSLIALYDR